MWPKNSTARLPHVIQTAGSRYCLGRKGGNKPSIQHLEDDDESQAVQAQDWHDRIRELDLGSSP
ncbi:hypothetical protein K456DRAFT_44357 [Colletotrichum gloeosporioides 23]|nr:hypothetical protein K456DRAFT_44357 [Colletotrichum gloeosporioides 23]